MESYALLYHIEKYSDRIYVFKPDRVLFGKYNKETEKFICKSNTEIPVISNKISNTKFCVSEPMSKEDFLKTFKSAENIKEAKKLLLEESKKILMFGVKEKDEIIIQNIVTNEFEEELSSRNLTDEGYKKIKEIYNFEEEITVIFEDEIQDLLATDDIDDFREKFFESIIHKELYKEKYNTHEECIAIVLTDEELIELLSNDDLNYLKKDLKASYDYAIKIYNQKNNSLSYRYKAFYNQIIFASTLEEINNVFEEASHNYKLILEELTNLDLEETEYNFCNTVLTAQCSLIEKLNNEFNDINEIINLYKDSYDTSKNAIDKISDILEQKGFKFIEEPVEEVKTNVGCENVQNIMERTKFNYLEIYNAMTSKIIGRNSQIDRILTTIKMVDDNPNSDKKHSCIIAGTTGTGKTQTFKELERLLPSRPVIIVDTNQITQQGYVGGTIEEKIIGELLDKAHQINDSDSKEYTKDDLVLAEHGIIFLDEIDKRKESLSIGPDVNGSGVINQLLKLMDGTTYKITRGIKSFKFDTSKLVVFAGGAFQEYFEQTEKKIGYGNSEAENFFKYKEVDPSELVKYGLSSQFIGRCDSVILYPPHDKESLLNLEKNKKTSCIENMRLLFKCENVDLVWDDEVVVRIVEEALALKEGGRSLNRVISRCLNDVYSEIQKYPNVYKIIYLTEEAIQDPKKVILIRKDNSFILMDSVIKRNDSLILKNYDDNKVTVNVKALRDAKKYKMALQAPQTTELMLVKTKTLHQ